MTNHLLLQQLASAQYYIVTLFSHLTWTPQYHMLWWQLICWASYFTPAYLKVKDMIYFLTRPVFICSHIWPASNEGPVSKGILQFMTLLSQAKVRSFQMIYKTRKVNIRLQITKKRTRLMSDIWLLANRAFQTWENMWNAVLLNWLQICPVNRIWSKAILF